jgi:ubiquinone/menaquinone biosynthesis C-methylase UbiE
MDRATRIVPALGYAFLTPFYDSVVRATTREKLFKSKLLSHAGLSSSETILDVGCGTGTLLHMATVAKLGQKLTGLDADPHQLEAARKKLGPGIDLVEGYSTELPFENESIDCVLSSLFFHHLDRDSKRRSFDEIFVYFGKAAGVLSPTGERRRLFGCDVCFIKFRFSTASATRRTV